MSKVKVAIIGTGNIGTDLLIKIQRSKYLECSIFCGKNPNSEGIKRADRLGVKTSFESIKAIQDNPDICDIVFDATSAKVHFHNAQILEKMGKFVIDLTPSRIGTLCIPVLNLEEGLRASNVNMITCGGQAAVPIARALMKVHPEIQYVEIASCVASKSIGPGTRINIDEYTQATKDALIKFAGVPKAKAIISINPAEPPITMHNTVYAVVENPRMQEVVKEVEAVETQIREYVPGYQVSLKPVYENGRLVTIVKVTGAGDFLPKYSGNLDIITAAGIKVAEEFAKRNFLSSEELI